MHFNPSTPLQDPDLHFQPCGRLGAGFLEHSSCGADAVTFSRDIVADWLAAQIDLCYILGLHPMSGPLVPPSPWLRTVPIPITSDVSWSALGGGCFRMSGHGYFVHGLNKMEPAVGTKSASRPPRICKTSSARPDIENPGSRHIMTRCAIKRAVSGITVWQPCSFPHSSGWAGLTHVPPLALRPTYQGSALISQQPALVLGFALRLCGFAPKPLTP